MPLRGDISPAAMALGGRPRVASAEKWADRLGRGHVRQRCAGLAVCHWCLGRTGCAAHLHVGPARLVGWPSRHCFLRRDNEIQCSVGVGDWLGMLGSMPRVESWRTFGRAAKLLRTCGMQYRTRTLEEQATCSSIPAFIPDHAESKQDTIKQSISPQHFRYPTV
ncbi:hypothetical protein CALVIDRAFT_291701 [Calocera viscosa TUFC12733]|uniref:Uncharacterized protein n=1 Tax=Calocera viscosa (strain TUFC12733) TaxID=1330018 RepID=A0A167IT65_CALVF|nr:hypothetical protein CALVIDRAFT_291701 [Calocera viscosa TUFC12733]